MNIVFLCFHIIIFSEQWVVVQKKRNPLLGIVLVKFWGCCQLTTPILRHAARGMVGGEYSFAMFKKDPSLKTVFR